MRQGLGIAAVLLLAACGSGGAATPSSPTSTPTASASPSPASTIVTGQLSVSGKRAMGTQGLCLVDDGYDDVDSAQITLATDAGSTLDVTDLTEQPTTGPADGGPEDCVYTFSFKPLQLDPNAYYSVEIGRRGKVRYTGEQLTQQLQLSLG